MDSGTASGAGRGPAVPAGEPEELPRRDATIGALLWAIGIAQFAIATAVVVAAYSCAKPGGCFAVTTNLFGDLGSGGFLGTPSTARLGLPWPTSALWPVFNYSLFVTGATLVAGALLLARSFPPVRQSQIGLALIALVGLGGAGLGTFAEDTIWADHVAFGLLASWAIAFGIFALGVAFLRGGRTPRAWGRSGIVVGIGLLLPALLGTAGGISSISVFGTISPDAGLGTGALNGGLVGWIAVALGLGWLFWLSLALVTIRPFDRGPSAPRPSGPHPGAADGAWIWLLGLVGFVVAMAVSPLGYPCTNFGGCYNLGTNPISDFGSAGYMTGTPGTMPYLGVNPPWPVATLWPLFNFAIVLFGVGLFTGAFFVYRAFPRGRGTALGTALLGIAGLGAAGVGIVPEDTLLAVHADFALVAFGLAPIGVVVLGVALLGAGRRARAWGVYTLASGLASIPALLLFVAPGWVGMSAWAPYGAGFGYGGMERLIVAAPLLWVGVAMATIVVRRGSLLPPERSGAPAPGGARGAGTGSAAGTKGL